MSKSTNNFLLPGKVDGYLGVLSKIYKESGEVALLRLLANSKIHISEAWTYDNWDNGQHGHAIYLTVPQVLFIENLKNKSNFEERIHQDLNSLHNEQGEFIAKVIIDLEISEDDSGWRESTGALLDSRRQVAENSQLRLWGNSKKFRLFISHKTEFKKETAAVKNELERFGVSCFVAHEDIHPTEPWQDEIEKALATMEGFVALLTDKYHESDWTDQEVGYAVARGVKIVSMRITDANGIFPYGFIGKYQALQCDWNSCAIKLVRVLMENPAMVDAYIEAMRSCSSWDNGNFLATALDGVTSLSERQINQLVAIYNENGEIRGSFGFNGSKPSIYGGGLLGLINRLGSKQYHLDNNDWKIKPDSK